MNRATAKDTQIYSHRFSAAVPRAFGEALPPVGAPNVNALTNRAFFARHPERRGRPIGRDEPHLVREWMAIRESLQQSPPASAAVPAAPLRSSPALAIGVSSCPVEDPFPMSIHKRGSACVPQGRKCWPNEGWVDIIDSDMPCNDESQRSPAAYIAVLDYFNVAHPANARYVRTARDTFCNIYVHDVTRAMRASIPHWIRDPAQTGHKPIGRRELNANATFDWINAMGRSVGWIPIDRAMIDWINRQQTLGQSIPFPQGVIPAGIAAAGARIAALPHPDPRLPQQDAYVSQHFANLGLPTVIVWKNPTGGPGHVAMVRPESAAARGIVHSSGLFTPLSAQAGAQNYDSRPATWIASQKYRSRQLWVHA